VANRRTLLAAAAIVLAVAASLGVYLYVSGADKRAEDKVQLVDAYVAAQDIPKGTTGDTALAEGLLTPQKVLKGSVPPSAITDSSQLKGKVAASAISLRQYITSTSFVAPSEGGGGSLAAAIADKNLVAVTVGVDDQSGVAKQIAPGDRVSVMEATAEGATYILTGVKVLAVGSETAATATGGDGQPSSTAAQSGLVTFQVPPEQALRIVQDNKAGSLYLVLEPLSGAGSGTAVPASGH
jgi:pilus assembly protein CpaB